MKSTGYNPKRPSHAFHLSYVEWLTSRRTGLLAHLQTDGGPRGVNPGTGRHRSRPAIKRAFGGHGATLRRVREQQHRG